MAACRSDEAYQRIRELDEKRAKELAELQGMIKDENVDGETCWEAIKRHAKLLKEMDAICKANPGCYSPIRMAENFCLLYDCEDDDKIEAFFKSKEPEEEDTGVVKFKSKLDLEIEELEKEEDKAFKELKEIANAEVWDGEACADAFFRLNDLSDKLDTAKQSHPNYKGPKKSENIFELAGKLLDQKVVPYFCDDDEAWQHVDWSKLTEEEE